MLNATRPYASDIGDALAGLNNETQTGISDNDIRNATHNTFHGNSAEAAAATANANFSLSQLINPNLWRGFPDEESMVREAMGTDNIYSVFGAVVFRGVDPVTGELPQNLTLSLRFHALKVPETLALEPEYTWDNDGDTSNQLYYYFGFVFLQDLLSRAYVNYRSNSTVGSPVVYAQTFPVPSFRDDLFAWGISRTLPLFMVMSWIYSVSRLTKNIVYEKEKRLKEYMKMMGLHERVHWLGWFITYACLMTVSVFLMTVVLCAGDVFAFSDPVLIFLYLELSAIASILVSFLFSTAFSHARIAAAVSGILYFGTYLPYVFIAIREETIGAGPQYVGSLLSTTAFGIAARYIAQLEEVGVGLQWSNAAQGTGPCDEFSFAKALAMMALDCVIYAILTWYFSAIAPRFVCSCGFVHL